MTTTSDRYAEIIEQINKHIGDFNAFLLNEYRFKEISPSDPETYLDRRSISGKQKKYPASKDKHGVYILCGQHNQTPANLGAYVGEASLQYIGKRLHAHHKWSQTAGVYIYGNNKAGFAIEVILAVPVPAQTPPSMAQALEGYIISKGLSGIKLFNGTGNRNQ